MARSIGNKMGMKFGQTLTASALLLSVAACGVRIDVLLDADAGTSETGGAGATLTGGASGLLGTGGNAGSENPAPAGGSSAVSQCAPSETLYGFDNSIQSFVFPYANPSTLNPTLSWDGSVGYPKPGSLAVTSAFTDVNQAFEIGQQFSTPLDLTGKVVTAHLRIDQDPATGSGPNSSANGTPDHPAGGYLIAKTGSQYQWMSGPWVNATPAGWIPVQLDLSNPADIDASDASTPNPADVRELGIQLNTSNSGTFSTAVVHIDSFTVQSTTVPNAPPFTFDCSNESFGVSYVSDKSLAPQLSWSSSVGSPNLGSLMLTAAFSAPSQEFGVSRNLTGHPVDLSGKTIMAKVRLDSGLSTDSSNLGTTKLVVSSGDPHVCAIGSPVSLTPGGDWVTVSLDVSSPSYTCTPTTGTGTFDSTQVYEIGIIFDTGAAGTYKPAIIHVDSFTVSP